MRATVLMAFGAVMIAAISADAQSLVLINDPSAKPKPASLSTGDARVMQRSVLPRVRKILARDICKEEDYSVSGVVKGAFTKKGAQQTLVFYQYCQTGNGLGSVGVAVIDAGRLEASWIAEDGGWTVDARKVPDIDQNGLDEVALFFSGGMHQGEGGSGVELMEFTDRGGFEGIGWFQADQFFDAKPSIAYKVSVKPGKPPIFYRQKYISRGSSETSWRPAGNQAIFRLRKPITAFTQVK